MQTRQNRVESPDVVSSKSKSPDGNATIMSLVDIPSSYKEKPSDEELDRQWTRGGELFSNDGELEFH